MAESTVSALQPSAAATYAEPLLSFLQQALDVRQSVPAADAQTIERAAVSALLALVMKLNEKQFKPLFLRLHAWSTTHPAGQPGRPPYPLQALTLKFVMYVCLADEPEDLCHWQQEDGEPELGVWCSGRLRLTCRG